MGITSLWAPVLWKHHVLPPTSLSTSFPRCMVSVLREHCCAEVVEPCGVCSTPVSPALTVSSSIKAGFGFISVVHWEGSVRGLLCAGVSCHCFTDLTQTWEVIWLRELRGFVWRQGDKAKQLRRILFSVRNCCRLNSDLRIKPKRGYNCLEKAPFHNDTAVFNLADLKAALGLPKGVKMSGSSERVSHVLTNISLLLSVINTRLSFHLVMNTTLESSALKDLQ